MQEWLAEGRQEAGERLLRRAAARFPSVQLPSVLPGSIDLVDLAEEIIAAGDEAAAVALLASRGL